MLKKSVVESKIHSLTVMKIKLFSLSYRNPNEHELKFLLKMIEEGINMLWMISVRRKHIID